MAWENRNGRRYYYRKRRAGKRVVSEYVGTGLAGEIAEIFDEEVRCETEYERRELRKQKTRFKEIDIQAGEVEDYTRTVTRACLLLAGYHTHKGQWRRLKNV
jgi:hypothetical protein